MSGQNVGSVRPTQLIYTYGVGSAVDLPQFSAMVMGLDDWSAACMEEIREDRLLRVVRSVLGAQVRQLKAAPLREDVPGRYSAIRQGTACRWRHFRVGWCVRSAGCWRPSGPGCSTSVPTRTVRSGRASATRTVRASRGRRPFRRVSW
jgi:hypothetical protein